MCYRELSAGHVGGALFAVEVDVVVVLNPEILLTQPLVLVGVCEGYCLIDQVACLALAGDAAVLSRSDMREIAPYDGTEEVKTGLVWLLSLIHGCRKVLVDIGPDGRRNDDAAGIRLNVTKSFDMIFEPRLDLPGFNVNLIAPAG